LILIVIGQSARDGNLWRAAIQPLLPDERICLPEEVFDRSSIDIAIVAAPPRGSLADLPKLRFIQSLWVGVDGLLDLLPENVPVARLVDPSMTRFVVESAVLSVLLLHRRFPEYRIQQLKEVWKQLPQPSAVKRNVGILGMGELGGALARELARFGFSVSGWSRRRADISGVRCMAGPDELVSVLDRSDILVNLLPLTDQTRGILDKRAFAVLPDGAALINLARGAHLVEEDLLDALNGGKLSCAILDVFATEPLPRGHPFWRHPKVTITPHVAGPSDLDSAASIAAEAIRAFRQGRTVPSLVDRAQGY
jgi:glyoxylate/hydroxypyruvate reductase